MYGGKKQEGWRCISRAGLSVPVENEKMVCANGKADLCDEAGAVNGGVVSRSVFPGEGIVKR